jgi:hypothetical protein
MGQQQTCVDCGGKSPPTETNYTLISELHGWRLTRLRDAQGRFVAEWRCPSCWRAYKDRERRPSTNTRAALGASVQEQPGDVFARATRRLQRSR